MIYAYRHEIARSLDHNGFANSPITTKLINLKYIDYDRRFVFLAAWWTHIIRLEWCPLHYLHARCKYINSQILYETKRNQQFICSCSAFPVFSFIPFCRPTERPLDWFRGLTSLSNMRSSAGTQFKRPPKTSSNEWSPRSARGSLYWRCRNRGSLSWIRQQKNKKTTFMHMICMLISSHCPSPWHKIRILTICIAQTSIKSKRSSKRFMI